MQWVTPTAAVATPLGDNIPKCCIAALFAATVHNTYPTSPHSYGNWLAWLKRNALLKNDAPAAAAAALTRTTTTTGAHNQNITPRNALWRGPRTRLCDNRILVRVRAAQSKHPRRTGQRSINPDSSYGIGRTFIKISTLNLKWVWPITRRPSADTLPDNLRRQPPVRQRSIQIILPRHIAPVSRIKNQLTTQPHLKFVRSRCRQIFDGDPSHPTAQHNADFRRKRLTAVILRIRRARNSRLRRQ